MSARAALFGAALAVGTGCGGGSPLLHPARTLPSGDVRAAGGVAANVAPGSLGNDVARSRDIAAQNQEPQTVPEYAKGAIVAAAIAPGLSPFVGARVGVGNRFEGGLAYTGRTVRVDMRRSFDKDALSLSLGLGLSAALYGRQQGSDLPNVNLNALRGYGGDIPILVGWRSTGGLYMLWGGLRGGYEKVIVEQVTSEPRDITIGGVTPFRLDADRFYGGAVVGLATGFNHVHVAIEIAAYYQSANGTYNDFRATVQGLTLTPASALWWSF